MPLQFPWQFGPNRRLLGEFPLLMGIVNVTPDSFSDGGRLESVEAAVEHALSIAGQGADILDVGGESTRPGAAPVAVDEELRRVMPVIERLRDRTPAPISIDTSKAEVARAALAAGASIVNDVSGLTFDPGIVDVCAGSDCGVICMHIRGTPQTMQQAPQYVDVVSEVAEHLAARIAALESAGIRRERIALDPGIGFGKTAEHNLQLLSAIGRFRALGRPVLIGHSRKSFLKKLLGRPIDERLSGTIGVAIAAAMQSVDVLRIHDVGPVRDALLAWHAVAARVPSNSTC
jgi:dihydropteroate synthase